MKFSIITIALITMSGCASDNYSYTPVASPTPALIIQIMPIKCVIINGRVICGPPFEHAPDCPEQRPHEHEIERPNPGHKHEM